MLLSEKTKYKLSEYATSLLRLFPAELAHDLGVFFLKHNVQKFIPRPSFLPSLDLSMEVETLGAFAHPIGLAAGFDKNGVAICGLNDLGFSLIEVGTVTPKPQAGNSKPRLFRQADQSGLINRMGFNNAGVAAMKSRLLEGDYYEKGLRLGVNLGKNKDTPVDLAIDDYLHGLRETLNTALYFVINVSSPNTPGLRELASSDFLRRLAGEINSLGSEVLAKVWVKVDPDMTKSDFQVLIDCIAHIGFGGVILTNTHSVQYPHKGGQSGHPLGIISSLRLEWTYEVAKGSLPVIGVGGILSGGDILQKVMRGADLVQIYSAMIYRGPWVVQKLLMELEWELKNYGFGSLKEAKNTHYG